MTCRVHCGCDDDGGGRGHPWLRLGGPCCKDETSLGTVGIWTDDAVLLY